MNKKLSTLLVFLTANSVFASYLWNIDCGVKEFNKGNYNYSRDYFIQYLKSNPNDADGYWWLGRTYQKLSDEENSIKNFEKSYNLEIKNNEIEKISFDSVKKTNIEDYFDMALEYFNNGNYKEADFYADMMLKLDNKSSSAYFIKAKIAKMLKNDDEAIEYLNQAIIYNNDILKTNLAKALNISKVPNTTKNIYKFNAYEFYYKGQILEAIHNAQQYVEIDKSIDMTNFLINLYIKNNDNALAKILIDEAKKSDIANIQTYISEAQIAKDLDEAEKILLNAYKINPNNQDILLNLANLYLRKEDYKNSLKYFEILNTINTDLYEGYFGLAYSMLKLDKSESSLDIIRKMDRMNPETSENLYLLSLFAQNNKSYKEALEYLDKAIAKDENANYYFEKAKVFYLLKDYKNSLENLKLTSKTDTTMLNKPSLDEYYLKNYIKLNMPKEARNLLSYDIKLDKSRIMYKYYLYELCKLENNGSSICQKSFKMPKPSSANDYADISEILFEKGSLKDAFKTAKSGIKKYHDSNELVNQKNKLEYYCDKH